jgi:hypothetical protein
MGEDLRFSSETIHYSVAVFDAYFQLPNIMVNNIIILILIGSFTKFEIDIR